MAHKTQQCHLGRHLGSKGETIPSINIYWYLLRMMWCARGQGYRGEYDREASHPWQSSHSEGVSSTSSEHNVPGSLSKLESSWRRDIPRLDICLYTYWITIIYKRKEASGVNFLIQRPVQKWNTLHYKVMSSQSWEVSAELVSYQKIGCDG